MLLSEVELQQMRVVAETGAQAAGQSALSYLRQSKPLQIEVKGPQDFVTAVDKEVEWLLRRRLQDSFSDHAILGEEFGLDREGASVVWVLDPIDGTSNFMRDRPGWCVSVGAMVDQQPVLGVIYDPVKDELYSAVTGMGATRNGEPIFVNREATLGKAVFGVGFTSGKSVEAHAQQISHILNNGCEYRRFGSSAMMLAHVADGRLDGYADGLTCIWDVLAGLVLVREAGGTIEDFTASGAERGAILAAAPWAAEMIGYLLEIDRKALPGLAENPGETARSLNAFKKTVP
ncbi:inositol monophosphatase family protein [Roseinatronobacter alkalisoli]|uniref:Inositol-1-monophosphatase n=1 Tax=Roseinatronobacter alkalisoli TaxID=3028235 RepID=A0ABT5THD0_9RHOB|nr:inositol monophosphatase [Roseinatronobacter sp. HJB301]MDD7973592.1 inositol monophosphatase [Roseinatronobacter sp. HJB301]